MTEPQQSQFLLEHDELSLFSRQVFNSLPRADQRRWADIYIRGLLTVPGRKSVRNTALTILSDPGATQALQQFVNQSPWDWRPVRAVLAGMVEAVRRSDAWVVQHTVFPKRGPHSVGVEPRYVQHDERTINSQLGVAIYSASADLATPMNWRLHLSDRWLADQSRRCRGRIPAELRPRSSTDLVLDMIDEMDEQWNLRPSGPVLAGVTPPDAAALMNGLLDRGVRFLLYIDNEVGRLFGSEVTDPSWIFRRAAGGATMSARGQVHVSVTQPTSAGAHVVPVPAVRTHSVRLSVSDGSSSEVRLIREIDRRGDRFWLTNLPSQDGCDLSVVQAAWRRARSAAASVDDEFGLRHFEGRSYPGWHHHVTLVSAAATFANLFRRQENEIDHAATVDAVIADLAAAESACR